MKEYTAYDLENAIMKAQQIEDDLQTFYKYHGDAKYPMTEDEVGNTILGLMMIAKMRFWELNDMHAHVFELNEYCTDPVKLEARENFFKVKKGKK